MSLKHICFTPGAPATPALENPELWSSSSPGPRPKRQRGSGWRRLSSSSSALASSASEAFAASTPPSASAAPASPGPASSSETPAALVTVATHPAPAGATVETQELALRARWGSQLAQVAAYEDVEGTAEEKAAARRQYCIDCGRAGGILGGRPSTVRDPKQNALRPTGTLKRRWDLEAHEGVKMCAWLKSQRALFSDLKAYWKHCARQTDYTKAQLEAMLKKERFWQSFLVENKRGTGGSLRRQGCNESLELVKARSQGRGCRRKGAGRKDDFVALKERVKNVAEAERQLGHSLNKSDLWLEFRIAASQEIRRLQEDASNGAQSALRVLRQRIQKLKASRKYLGSFQTRLQAFCKLKLRKPQRITRFSPEEEALAAEMGWRWNDRAIWLAGCAGEEELKKHVLEPAKLQANRAAVVLGYSDQVPYWTGLETERQLYLETEVKVHGEAGAGPIHCSQQVSQRITAAQAGAGGGVAGLEASAEAAVNNQTQTRGTGESSDGRVRVTVELRQLILNYFAEDKEPVGVRGETLLIFPGVRARLENISDDGKWLEDEVFEVCGEPVVRKAGQSAGNIMITFRKLRKEHPEAFEGIRVWQQPAAVMDSILQKWSVDALQKLYPFAVWTRDCLGAALTDRAMEACFAANHICSWVPPGMTPCMQLTDTDEAAPFKAACREAKEEMRQLLRAKAIHSYRKLKETVGKDEQRNLFSNRGL